MTTEDISRMLSISKNSAIVTANRYVKAGLLSKLKRNIFLIASKEKALSEENLFEIANYLQVPSYVSFGSALSYYDLSTQQQRFFVESAGLKRTASYHTDQLSFTYTKLKKDFYSGFIRKENRFIATPEKALADVIYMVSIGRYSCDFDAINFKKIDGEIMTALLQKTNRRALSYWEQLCNNYDL
ncbi:MAG: hypothetical protein WDZ80_07050 [Candidatus Paceibacterota bacterium]